MKTKVVIDSAGDTRFLDGIDLFSVPLKIIAGDTEFTDDIHLDVDEMIDFLKKYKGKVSSSCPGVGDFSEAFKDAENIFVITITSGLSGSYNSACVAAEAYKEKYPHRNIYVVDSLSAGPEMLLLAEKICDLACNGLDFDDIVEQVEQYKTKTGLLFSLESLHNFANNGRVSPAVAKLVGLLGINLIGKASDEGTLEPISKVRGDKKVIPTLINNLTAMGYFGGKVRIAHCHNPKCANSLKSEILKLFPAADIKIYSTRGLCSFYAEEGGFLVGFETERSLHQERI